MSRTDAREAITQAHHGECARVVASLTRRFGDPDIAEEAALFGETATRSDDH